ncbi:TPR repeat-containing protein C19B12.01 [Psilocybe cubensis]|uniref:TPR repeat-containing protein C19B12.01 n=2 Tax=Psilocybe cubensis TaxID=181762 RepID=A0ACB8H2C5_PSICU|nr:TPR repeat-containing protein C19B12.01 [Psilocybe cubensis]KAH9482148.1 TPR repeat-containing protein C19B12.01 [Psilocybe cubensis]
MEQHLELIEKALLRGQWDTQIPESSHSSSGAAVTLSKMTVEGRFRDVLVSDTVRGVFQFQPLSDDYLDRPLQDYIDLSVTSSTAAAGKDQVEEELARLAIAVTCLHAFVQANWTGPELDIHPLEVLTAGNPDDASRSSSSSSSPSAWTEDILSSKAISELAYGGEPAYHLAKAPAFLRLAQLLMNLPYQHIASIHWWRLRVELVRQQILDEAVSVPEDYHALLSPLTASVAREPDLAGRLYLELGLLDHLLARDKSAAEYFVKAARSTGLEYELTGALGKRTKFQVTELSQLVLLAESRLDASSGEGEGGEALATSPTLSSEREHENENGQSERTKNTTNVPETMALNDDTLLEQTQFTSSHPAGPNSRLSHIDPSAQPPLHPLDQCILLSLCLNVRNTSPSHGLTAEQMSPYVARVIAHPRNWSVHTMALLLRSRLESTRTRTVERSALQLQALIDQMPTSDSAAPERLRYFHEFPLPSRWEMEKELAGRYLSIGVVKSALEIYERLEMWEEVVRCYGALERPDKGIAIVRDLLEGRKHEADAVISQGKASTSLSIRKTRDTAREAKLWCLLGDLDAPNAVAHYSRAWAVSGGTSGRAMRSLGGYHFARADFRAAITSLRRAVRINPLLTRSWFILGCACMRVEEWEEAKEAFARCVAIDEEDGESWNNLASMYLRIGYDPRKQRKREVDEEEEEEATASPSTQTTNNNDEVEGSQQPAASSQTPAIPFENKLLAFRALKQGLRCSYENWRMWYNYMVVAMDVGELQEACRALGRVVEQTGDRDRAGAQVVDEDVLDRLVDAVTRAPAKADDTSAGVDDGAGAGAGVGVVQNPNEGHGLYKNVLNLFERTLLPRLSSPRIFRAYARLMSWQSRWEETIKAYLDAYRCSVAGAGGGTMGNGSGGMDGDAEKWREAVVEVEEVVDVLRNFGPRVGGGYKWKLQARSIVRTFMGRTREFEDEPEWERLKELLDD